MDINDADFKLALQLQEQFDRETEIYPVAVSSNQLKRTSNVDHFLALQLQEELNKETEKTPSQPQLPHENTKTSIIDKFWELNDPNPDIHGLFLEFNTSYFWKKLEGIEVRWSNRMTLCAGICCYEGRNGLCSIRLSLPLLKLRPRKDLVETLLHEMIHAYLFVTHNNRDHDAHGPEFLKHMYRINKLTGANITVYHNFHDEVNEYRQHWWRCNGPCRHRPPYYGIVRRAMNRAPSANDYWWDQHKMTCNGTYEKIKEPEGNNSKRKGAETITGTGKKVKSENMSIKEFISSSNENQFTSKSPGRHRSNVPDSANENSSQNIHTLVSPTKRTKNSKIIPFAGKGNILGSSPLQNINGVKIKNTLRSYFKSSKGSPDKHSYSSNETKVGKEKELLVPSVKKQPTADLQLNASPLSRLLLPHKQETINTPNFRTPTKIDEFWPKTANPKLSSQLKDEMFGKKLLPDRKLSTASPLNHVKKIFMTGDDVDDNGESFQNRLLPDITKSNMSVQKKQSVNNILSLENPILLDNENEDSANNTMTNTVICPVCNQEIEDTQINNHLDICLSNSDEN